MSQSDQAAASGDEDSQPRYQSSSFSLNHNAQLEELPPEIREIILSNLGVSALVALVGASPAYYRHHLLNRRRLLCNALSISLGSTVADALAVYQSKQPECMARQYPEDTRQFVQSYQQRSVDDVSEEEATKLASFHTFVVQPLINYYVTWAMEHLAAESECPQDEVGPSLTEQKRIIRAFYRFQVCCNLFGKSADDSGWHNFTPVQILRLFFCKFQPWEVEEIACVYDFAKEIYDQAYRDLLCDEREQSPGLEGESPDASEMIFDLEDEETRSALLTGTVSRGLQPLHTMLIRARTQSKRISVMKKYMMMPAGAFIEGEALGKEAQSERRSETPLPEDSRERHHEDLLFTGDHDPLDAVDSTPPFTWTLMWRGYYSNYYGYCVPGAMRRWGYIMWDKGRLERNDALSVLDRQWDLEEFSAGPWGWVVV